ncbi:MAG: glycosyltransferase [Anaerolineae bacterium]
MKVIHLLPYFAPAWEFGGVVRAAYGLTRALVRAGHAVTVLTTDASLTGQPFDREEVLDGVRVRRAHNVLPGLRRLNLSSPLALPGLLRTELAQADVLHLHEFRTVEALMGLSAARRWQVPVVLSPHGTLGYGAGRTRIKQGWDALFGAWSAARVSCVAALTADEAAEVRDLWGRFGVPLPDARLQVVPNGVDLAEFRGLPDGAVFRSRWQIPSTASLILFLGRLHRRKGVHHLIDALVTLQDAWLAVVGPDEGELAALQAQAQALGVAGRLVFTGLLDGQEKMSAFTAADVLALPAVGEGLPMVLLEAMAAGLPVAISDECHLPEAIDAGAGVRLPVLEGAAIAEAIRPVLADEALRQKMRVRAARLVAERFTWDAVAEQMAALYRQVAEEERRNARN